MVVTDSVSNLRLLRLKEALVQGISRDAHKCGWDVKIICKNKRGLWFKLRSLQFRHEITIEKISTYICFNALGLANLDMRRSSPLARTEVRTKATKLA